MSPGPGRRDETTRRACARTLWSWLRLHQPLRRSDALLVFGSSDLRVARHAVRLWQEAWAPRFVFTGGRGRLTARWPRTEAETFAEVAIAAGVPAERIRVETRSTNTGENVVFARDLVRAEPVTAPRRWILVHKPHLERRALATFRKHWPGAEALASSPEDGFDAGPGGAVSRKVGVHRLVGEVHRMLEYPGRGFLVPEPVPEDVLSAWRILLDMGYDRDLVPRDG